MAALHFQYVPLKRFHHSVLVTAAKNRFPFGVSFRILCIMRKTTRECGPFQLYAHCKISKQEEFVSEKNTLFEYIQSCFKGLSKI